MQIAISFHLCFCIKESGSLYNVLARTMKQGLKCAAFAILWSSIRNFIHTYWKRKWCRLILEHYLRKLCILISFISSILNRNAPERNWNPLGPIWFYGFDFEIGNSPLCAMNLTSWKRRRVWAWPGIRINLASGALYVLPRDLEQNYAKYSLSSEQRAWAVRYLDAVGGVWRPLLKQLSFMYEDSWKRGLFPQRWKYSWGRDCDERDANNQKDKKKKRMSFRETVSRRPSPRPSCRARLHDKRLQLSRGETERVLSVFLPKRVDKLLVMAT